MIVEGAATVGRFARPLVPPASGPPPAPLPDSRGARACDRRAPAEPALAAGPPLDLWSALAACLALAAGSAGFAGCKGEASPQETFCAEVVAVFCTGNADCCMDATARYADADECAIAERARCTLGTGSAFLGSPPRVRFDVVAADAYLTELREAVATCAPPPSLDAYEFFEGTGLPGTDCSPLGADLSPIVACAPGARCLLAASPSGTLSGTCVAETPVGAACVAETCVPGAFCELAADGSAGECVAKRGEFEACRVARECLTGECFDGLCRQPMDPAGGGYCVPGASGTPTDEPDGGTPMEPLPPGPDPLEP